MKNTTIAYLLGYNAYKNGQGNNPYESEKGIMIPELCRYNQWEQGFNKAADEDLELERGIRKAFELIEEKFGEKSK